MAYLVCFGIWLMVAILRRSSITAAPGPTPTSEAQAETVPERLTFHTEFQEFAGFANSLFPWLAVIALTAGSFAGATLKQQQWLTTGIVTLCGWCIVWVGQLTLPMLQIGKASTSTSYGTQGSAFDQFLNMSLLLLSLLTISAAVRFGVDSGRTKWLAMAVVGVIVYFAVVSRRLTVQTQTVAIVPLMIVPGVLLVPLASGVSLAIYLHWLSWVAGGVIGYAGCLGIWIFQIIRTIPKPPPPPAVPEFRSSSTVLVLLTVALLAALGIALYAHEVSALTAALLATLGGLSLWFAWMFVWATAQEGPPQIDTNWGGLGGGMGGWRCSASMVYGLCALTFAICTGVAFVKSPPLQKSTVATSTSPMSSEPDRSQTAEKNRTPAQAGTLPATSTNKEEAAKPETK